ncbi:WPP domain-associated protein [Euphorbia lathyris]|uniref:WPP domain-associated protein n=1 Tax=Euphorbia lathyris TaxID=212925 RepID=UPI00331382D5
MESTASMDASVSACNGVIVQRYDNAEESENLDLLLLKDFDSCIEDLEDQLTVSRMVSDSVTRGMVCAVEQEAVEKIAQKDLELKKLKETLPLYYVGSDGNESMRYSMKYDKPKSKIYGFHLTNTNSKGMVDHGKLPDSLEDLKFASKEQLRKLKKEIDKIKGSTSIRRKGSGCNLLESSGSELLGLSHILPENVPNKWIDVDRALDGLRTTLEYICIQSEDVVCCSKSLLSDWQLEIEFQSEIEGMVIKNCIQSLQEDFEQRLWDHNSQSYGNESANWLEIINEISSLRHELEAISKLFSVPESGQLLSHGSLEHRNGSGDHFSSAPIWEENGNHDEPTVISVPETLEHAQLKHLSKEELFNYFKTEMSKMKRDHELQLQKETEKYFSLKRYLYFKELGSSLPVRKDKELDSFRKKIPELILRLDNILTEIQKLPPFSNNGDSLDNLKDRLESLRLENRQLRDLVMDKKKEIKSLESQASDVSEQILKHSFAEETLSRKLKNLECTMEDAQIEASISQDLYKFLLGKVLSQMEGLNEELNMEYDMMLGIYANMLKEAAENAGTVNNLQTEDSDIESIIMQGMCEIVFRESLKEAKDKVRIWNQKYIDEIQVRISLEMKQLEKEESLKFNIAEREKLEQENVLLRAMVDDKAKLAEVLVKEKGKFELASQELDRLRVQSSEQDTLISEYNKEVNVVKSDLARALEKVEMYRRQISQLGEQLEIVMQNLREADEEKNMLHSISQKYQHDLSLVEARERDHMKQLNSTILLVQELSKTMTAFECRTTKDINMNCLRLGSLSTQFSSVIQKANRLKKMGFHYKCDLQKAEAEVDLLGDEVDALVSLLEKIYIALDHYSPILQHYPGVMEILKLVRRELSGQSVKSV